MAMINHADSSGIHCLLGHDFLGGVIFKNECNVRELSWTSNELYVKLAQMFRIWRLVLEMCQTEKYFLIRKQQKVNNKTEETMEMNLIVWNCECNFCFVFLWLLAYEKNYNCDICCGQ